MQCKRYSPCTHKHSEIIRPPQNNVIVSDAHVRRYTIDPCPRNVSDCFAPMLIFGKISGIMYVGEVFFQGLQSDAQQTLVPVAYLGPILPVFEIQVRCYSIRLVYLYIICTLLLSNFIIFAAKASKLETPSQVGISMANFLSSLGQVKTPSQAGYSVANFVL